MIENQEIKRVTRGAATVGIATLASRALGFVRDVVLAYFFGAASSTDAFFVAFRIPNVFRRFVGEGRGAFVSVFIPVLADSIEKSGKE
ncbi:MAG: lipid II flippase MurJ, partial [Candidatus Bathyarchaeia archaeon]